MSTIKRKSLFGHFAEVFWADRDSVRYYVAVVNFTGGAGVMGVTMLTKGSLWWMAAMPVLVALCAVASKMGFEQLESHARAAGRQSVFKHGPFMIPVPSSVSDDWDDEDGQ